MTKKKTTAKKKTDTKAGRPSTYDQGKPKTQSMIDSAAKKIGKAEKKPSVTAVAREYMGAGWDNDSVLKLLKAAKIKHTKDAAGMASLRRSLARSGDIDIGGPSKKKAPAAKTSKKKTASKKKVAKKKAAKKKAAKKVSDKVKKEIEDDDFLD